MLYTESLKAEYERCVREYHESEQEVIIAQSSDKMDCAGFLGESQAEDYVRDPVVADVRTEGGPDVG